MSFRQNLHVTSLGSSVMFMPSSQDLLSRRQCDPVVMPPQAFVADEGEMYLHRFCSSINAVPSRHPSHSICARRQSELR